MCARGAEAGQRRGARPPALLLNFEGRTRPGSPLRRPPTSPAGDAARSAAGRGGAERTRPGQQRRRTRAAARERAPAGGRVRPGRRERSAERRSAGGGGETLGEPRRARGTRPEAGCKPRHRAAARAMSFSEMNRRTLAFRGGGLITGGGGPTNNNAGGEASAWPPQPQPRQPAPQQPNGRGADEEMDSEGLEPQDSEASAGAAAAEDAKELLLPQDAGGPASLGGGAGGPLLAERNRRTLAFRGGGAGGLGNNGSSRGRPETSAWPLRHFNGRGPAAVELELDALEGKELMQDGASLSDSTEDEEEGASPGDGSGAEGGSCGSSRRSGGDGGDDAEGSGVGAGDGEAVQHFPLARPKSLLQKLQCSFQTSWLKDFPWLRYSRDTGLMFCGWCHKPPEDGGADLSPVGHDELSRGTRNYKKTLLLRHHVSTEHKLHEANAQVQ